MPRNTAKLCQAQPTSAFLNPAEPRSHVLPCWAHFLSDPDTWLEPLCPVLPFTAKNLLLAMVQGVRGKSQNTKS